MANEPLIKTRAGLETKDFNKGVSEMKRQMKDLEKVTDDAWRSMGEAINLDTAQLDKFSNAIRGLGEKMTKSGNEGVQAFGKVLKSITPLQAAVAGIGIGAAITAFKALKSEAESFQNTIEGLNLKMATQAYIETYRQALHDANSETGKSVGEAMASWEKGWARFTANLGATFVQWVAGDDTVGLVDAYQKVAAAAKEAEAAASRNETRGSEMADLLKEELKVRQEVADIEVKISEQRRIMDNTSKTAAERQAAEAKIRELINEKSEKQVGIAQKLYEKQQEMDDEAGDSLEDIQRITALYESWKGRIAAANNELATTDKKANSIADAAEKAAREAAKAAAQTKIETIAVDYEKNIDNAQKYGIDTSGITEKFRRDLVAALTIDVQDNDDVIENLMLPTERLQAHYDQLLAIMEKYNLDSADLRHKFTVLMADAEEQDKIELGNEEEELRKWSSAWIDHFAKVNGIDLSGITADFKEMFEATGNAAAASEVAWNHWADTIKKTGDLAAQTSRTMTAVAKEQDASAFATQVANKVVQMSIEATATSIGEMMGALIKGEDPWQAFANTAISAFGDMAVTVGKMAISTGVATLGIKAALESLNGYAAIAAGVALVALGTAVKSGLANVASGNYSSGMGTVNSNTSSSFNNAYEQREVYVNVTGTLKADGNQLVAVLNNTNKRNNITT